MSLFSILVKFISFLFLIAACILGYFAYEEWSDIYRYSDIGLVMVKDDHFQSLGARRPETNMKNLRDILGPSAALTYAHLDRDGNGLLSANEIEPVVHLIKQNSSHQVNNLPSSCNQDDCLKVNVEISKPTMTDSIFVDEDADTDLVKNTPCEKAVSRKCENDLEKFKRKVNATSSSNRLLSHRHFLAFLPRSKDLTVGRPFFLIDHVPEVDHFFKSRRISHENDKPEPYVELHERALSTILGHFYNGHVSLYPQNHPRYSVGIVRAKNAEYVEVLFRLNVEFSNFGAFIVVPSAIVGKVVFRLSDFKVMDFMLHQESDFIRVDQLEKNSYINGIMKMSKMEMKASSKGIDVSSISWTGAISPKEANLKMMEVLYNVKPLEFLSINDLSKRMKGEQISSEKRPILLIISMGDLYDQTCSWGCLRFRTALTNKKVDVTVRYEFTVVHARHRELTTWIKQMQKSNITKKERAVLGKIVRLAENAVAAIAISEDMKTILNSLTEQDLDIKKNFVMDEDVPMDVAMDERMTSESQSDDPSSSSEMSKEDPPSNILSREEAEFEAKKLLEKSASIFLAMLDKALKKTV